MGWRKCSGIRRSYLGEHHPQLKRLQRSIARQKLLEGKA